MDFTKATRLAGTLFLVLGIASCLTTPQAENPADPAANWSVSASQYRGPVSPDGWLKDIPSAELKKLVVEAIKRNHDLKAAAARMRAARARSVIEGADRFPQVRGNGDGSRAQTVDQESMRQRANDFGLALNLSWEIDLWGRLRDLSSAADREAVAAEADYRAARLSLAANTAKAWFNAIETELQVRLVRETLTSFKNNQDIIQRAFDAGIDAPGGDRALDLRLARSDVATADNQLALAGRNRDRSARSLETLLGRYPANAAQIAKTLPPIKRKVPAGLPSELLLRRPDLIAAEQRLAARGLRVSAANKAFLPSFTLTARAGQSSPELSNLLNAERLVANIAAGLAQPITAGGRLRGNLELTEAERDETLQNYAQASLEAFREVETALAAERYLAAQEAALIDA
ncbi:MAG: multidrug efflux system outer membrane protein, partial [Verrucomicrobiales bacterium]